MEITSRSFWTLVHGMGFGALYLLACSGALWSSPQIHRAHRHHDFSDSPFLKIYLFAMTSSPGWPYLRERIWCTRGIGRRRHLVLPI